MTVNHHIVCIYKKGWLNQLVILGIIFLVTTAQAQDAQPHERIQVLKLHHLKGEVPVFYSDGYEERAAYIQNLAVPASRFFQKPEILDVEVALQLVVLGPEDWVRFTKLPYGIAHILPDPPTAIMAASADNVIAKGIITIKEQMSKDIFKLLDEMEIPFDEAAATFTDLIAFHEMGHIYAHHHGSQLAWPEQKWLGEFVATYLAYAYMKENQPKLARLWEIMFDQLAVIPGVKHTTLTDFEELYLGVGGDNYRWYQAMFGQRVFEVYTKSGISFMHALKKSLSDNPVTSKDDPFRLKELDAISEGFTTWAKGPAGNLK
ncbi:hypothetical protein ACFLS9_00135 [Bacteroidota bacterium]